MPDVDEIRLDQLQPRQRGLVCYIEASDEDSERLMALGVCTGRMIELIQAGDPLILKVFASRVGVSSRLAARVFVEPLDVQPRHEADRKDAPAAAPSSRPGANGGGSHAAG